MNKNKPEDEEPKCECGKSENKKEYNFGSPIMWDDILNTYVILYVPKNVPVKDGDIVDVKLRIIKRVIVEKELKSIPIHEIKKNSEFKGKIRYKKM